MIATATYLERRGASLRALDQEITWLTNYAELATAEVAARYGDAIRGLRATRDEAARRLRELRAVSGNAWDVQEAMNDVEEAWNDLRNALREAISTL